MTDQEAAKTILTLLKEQKKIKNRELIAAIGGNEEWFENIREDLIFNDLAEDHKGVGLVYIGSSEQPEQANTGEDEQTKTIRPSPLSKKKKLSIFISYGRADASPFANQLRQDLEKQGYDVWEDVKKIYPSDQWSERIKEGINQADVLIAVLTRHSVRLATDADNLTQLDSFCLHEIRYAYAHRHSVILPIRLHPVEPPFELLLLDYIELDKPDQMPARLYDLLQEAEKNPGFRFYRTWPRDIKPMDFTSYLKLKEEDFTGRGWLRKEIDNWRKHQPQERMLLITGDPGIGKSAFVTNLVQQNPDGQVLAYHFCRSQEKSTTDAIDFIRSIAAMLATRYQEVLNVIDDADIQLRLRKGDKDELGDAWRDAVINPLVKIQSPPEGVRYLLIDALDEAQNTDSLSIINLLASRQQEFPDWLRIVATSRPEKEVLERFSGISTRVLDAQDSRNQDDLKKYLRNRGQEKAIRSQIEASSFSWEGFEEKILEVANGNFLYLKEALKAIESSNVSIEALPPTLSGLYLQFFERHFSNDEQVGAGKVPFSQVEPLLALLVAAHEPLPLSVVKLIEKQTGCNLRKGLRLLSGYISETGEKQERKFTLFHKSIVDWLTDTNRIDDVEPFTVEARIGHKYFAKTGLKYWKEEDYFIRQLPHHLKAAHYQHELDALLFQLDFLLAKVHEAGANALFNDLALGSKPEHELLRKTVQLSSHILTQAPNQLPAQLMGRLRERKEDVIRNLLTECENLPGKQLLPLTQSFTPPSSAIIRTLSEYISTKNAFAVLADGERVIMACKDNVLRVWDLETGKILITLIGHNDYVSSVKVLPDGKRVISASDDGTLKIWDLDEGRELFTLTGHTSSVDTLEVLPDGTRALSASYDGTLKIWDLDEGRELFTLTGHTSGVNAMAVLPGGKQAISASNDTTIKIWDLDEGRELFTLTGHKSWVDTLKVLPDGKRFIDNSLDVWDLEKGNKLFTLSGHKSLVSEFALLPDGMRAISASWDNTLKIWDLDERRELFTLTGHTSWVTAMAVFPDGKRAISASIDRTLKIWDLDEGQELFTLIGHNSCVDKIIVLPDGKRAISVSSDNFLRVWNLEKSQESFSFSKHNNLVTAITLLPDEKGAISSSWDNTLKIWDLDECKELYTLSGHLFHVCAVKIFADGTRALSASYDGTLKIWDLDERRELFTLTGHTSGVTAMAVFSDGKRAISASIDRTLKIWDLNEGQELLTLIGHKSRVDEITVLPDGTRALSASMDNTLKIWDLDEYKELFTLTGHTDRISAIAVLPNGKRAVSASDDGTLKIWDLGEGRELFTLTGHISHVETLEVLPDGTRAISASDDTIKIWDLDERRELFTLTGHTSWVNAMAVLPGGKHAISVSNDTTIKIWDLEKGMEVYSAFCEESINCLNFSKRGQFIIAGSDGGTLHFLRPYGFSL